MKIRVTNYFIAIFLHKILRVFWCDLFKRGIYFDKVMSFDYKMEAIDFYYLIQLR